MNADELIGAAVDETGFDDFGGQTFREGLDVLTSALAEEGGLSEIGHHVARGHLLRLLSNRLRIEDCYHRHPEIDRQETPSPIFVLGLPRTGTTALSTRLARDPATRSLRAWESAAPTPPPEAATQDCDPRIDVARDQQEAMHQAFPDMKKMYDASPTDPTECHDLLGMELMTHHFGGQYWVPSYSAWLLERDMTSAYRYHKRTLKLLQWHCPPSRWHLKSPVHMLSLDALDRVYPDARFIMTHRDPTAVLGSVCALIQVTLQMASDRRDPHRIGREQLEHWAFALRRAMEFRSRVGEARFADVVFAEQLRDPVGVIERAYDKLGMELTTDARVRMASWAETHTRGRHGSYSYRLADYGLDPEGVRERFREYLERFDVAREDVE